MAMAKRKLETASVEPELILDDWQKQVLAHKGNICLCTGRQIGKSTIVSIRAAMSALENPNTTIMIISSVERQAFLLFEKTLRYLETHHKRQIVTKAKEKPTKSRLKLKNGSVIYCLPAGISGRGIRGFTIDDLYADEAHFIPEDVWDAVIPMLVTRGGRINLLSTPDLIKGKEGYFYECSKDEDFLSLNLSTMEVAEQRQEPQRTLMLDFIEKKKATMSKKSFCAEFLGQFVDKMFQFFPNEWIDQVCSLEKPVQEWDSVYLGVDVAGMGDDESTFESLGRLGDKVYQADHQITTKTRTTETTQKILQLDRQYNYKKIGIDDGGMGVGVHDQLLQENQTKRKILALNNASRNIEEDRRKKLLKEDMYSNLLAMGERKEIKLLNNDEIKASLRSIHIDPDANTFRLTGRYSHITEGIIRSAWLAKGKSLNMQIYTIKT